MPEFQIKWCELIINTSSSAATANVEKASKLGRGKLCIWYEEQIVPINLPVLARQDLAFELVH